MKRVSFPETPVDPNLQEFGISTAELRRQLDESMDEYLRVGGGKTTDEVFDEMERRMSRLKSNDLDPA